MEKKPMDRLEALTAIVIMANSDGQISWAWLSKVKKLAAHFDVTADQLINMVSGCQNVADAETWLNKHKPKKIK